MPYTINYLRITNNGQAYGFLTWFWGPISGVPIPMLGRWNDEQSYTDLLLTSSWQPIYGISYTQFLPPLLVPYLAEIENATVSGAGLPIDKVKGCVTRFGTIEGLLLSAGLSDYNPEIVGMEPEPAREFWSCNFGQYLTAELTSRFYRWQKLVGTLKRHFRKCTFIDIGISLDLNNPLDLHELLPKIWPDIFYKPYIETYNYSTDGGALSTYSRHNLPLVRDREYQQLNYQTNIPREKLHPLVGRFSFSQRFLLRRDLDTKHDYGISLHQFATIGKVDDREQEAVVGTEIRINYDQGIDDWRWISY